MNFSDKLKQLRKEKKLSQADLAMALDVSVRTISNYESGERYPRYRRTYQLLAELLGCEAGYLMTDEEDFVSQAASLYGNRGKKQAQQLVADLTGCFAGGELSEEDIDEMMKAIQDAYWVAKQNNRKYAAKKTSENPSL